MSASNQNLVRYFGSLAKNYPFHKFEDFRMVQTGVDTGILGVAGMSVAFLATYNCKLSNFSGQNIEVQKGTSTVPFAESFRAVELQNKLGFLNCHIDENEKILTLFFAQTITSLIFLGKVLSMNSSTPTLLSL